MPTNKTKAFFAHLDSWRDMNMRELKAGKTVNELAHLHGIPPSVVRRWVDMQKAKERND